MSKVRYGSKHGFIYQADKTMSQFVKEHQVLQASRNYKTPRMSPSFRATITYVNSMRSTSRQIHCRLVFKGISTGYNSAHIRDLWRLSFPCNRSNAGLGNWLILIFKGFEHVPKEEQVE